MALYACSTRWLISRVSHIAVAGRYRRYCESFSRKQDVSLFNPGTWKQNDRCSYCGRQTPIPLQLNVATGQVYNRPADARKEISNTALPLELIRSGHEWWGPGGEPTWRHTWEHLGKDEPPLGVTTAALADPVYATASIDAGFNFTTVEWVCSNPGVGHGVTANHPNIERFRTPASARFVLNWCEKCVFALERDVDELTEGGRTQANVKAMSSFDWSTFILAAIFLSLASIGELKDIRLCSIAIDRSETLSRRWRRLLTLLGGIRRWTFLPSLMCATCNLVAIAGGDALSVCLNTIAVLFLYDIDNIAFAQLLPERLRSRIERDGRLQLEDRDIVGMQVLRRTYLPMIAGGVVLGVIVAAAEWNLATSYTPLLVNFVSCWLASIVAEVQLFSEKSVQQRGAVACVTIGRGLMGFGFFGVLLGLVQVL